MDTEPRCVQFNVKISSSVPGPSCIRLVYAPSTGGHWLKLYPMSCCVVTHVVVECRELEASATLALQCILWRLLRPACLRGIPFLLSFASLLPTTFRFSPGVAGVSILLVTVRFRLRRLRTLSLLCFMGQLGWRRSLIWLRTRACLGRACQLFCPEVLLQCA